jgi:hypothetical protein
MEPTHSRMKADRAASVHTSRSTTPIVRAQ